MFCRSCGTMIPEDSNFCPKCGVRVVMPKQDSPRQAVQKTSYAHTHQNVQAVKRVEQSHKVDGRLFREIAMLVGGLVVVWIGYATWIGSTVGRYLSTKTSNYRLEFGRSAPDAMQWVMGIGGFIINVVGAICLYVAVCALAQRFGAWRRQNKVVGTVFAVIVCLVVLVCFSLKTSATGQFGLWDYLIMAAIFGGMWKGGKRNNKQGKDKPASKITSYSGVDNNNGRTLQQKVVAPSAKTTYTEEQSLGGKQSDVSVLGRPANESENSSKSIVERQGKNGFNCMHQCDCLKKALQVLGVVLVIVSVGMVYWGVVAYNKNIYTEKFLVFFDDKNYDAAARLIEKIDISNARVQYALGDMYWRGHGFEEDDKAALKWWQKAASQGNADAQCMVGMLYYGKDYLKSVKCFRDAADLGNALAQCMLGLMYYEGLGVTKDDFEAVKWLRKAAEQGDKHAQSQLGCMYFNGNGVLQNYRTAAKWYGKAAEQGDAVAQYNLGKMYENGYGVSMDDAKATRYYCKAAKQGNEKAQETLRKKGLTW